MGEYLARMEIFLFFSSILHSFDLRLPEGHSLPNLEGYFGTTLTPDSYQVKHCAALITATAPPPSKTTRRLLREDDFHLQVELVERLFDADINVSQSLPECFTTKKMSAGSH